MYFDYILIWFPIRSKRQNTGGYVFSYREGAKTFVRCSRAYRSNESQIIKEIYYELYFV